MQWASLYAEALLFFLRYTGFLTLKIVIAPYSKAYSWNTED